MQQKLSNIWNYSQPDFYHFTEDSIFLAKFTSEYLRDGRELVGAELFAGCGVISLELLQRVNTIKHLSLYEIEEEFYKHWLVNSKQLLESSSKQIEYHLRDFRSISDRVDFIIANPPYFFKEHSRVSPNVKRQRARMMSRDDYVDLFNLLPQRLKSGGGAFLAMREDIKPFIANGKLKVNECRVFGKTAFYSLLKTD